MLLLLLLAVVVICIVVDENTRPFEGFRDIDNY
jgi:hypothetical protein